VALSTIFPDVRFHDLTIGWANGVRKEKPISCKMGRGEPISMMAKGE
jgi:hypothetical protein